MINQTLKQLNFNDKEIAVYLAVVKNGKITPAEISKIININRSTVYSVAKELIKKGVITEELGDIKTYLMALPPQDLGKITQKQEHKLKQTKTLVKNAIDELQNISKGTKYSIPKITFITEENLEHHLYKQTPIWNESIRQTKSNYFGYQDTSFVEHYEKWIDWYWNSKDSQDITLRLLSSNAPIENRMKEKKYERRIIKFWDKCKDITATNWIMGNHIVMISTNQRPHYLVEIYDSVMASNMREIFKGIWDAI